MLTKLPHAHRNGKRLAAVLSTAALNLALVIFLIHPETFSSAARVPQAPAASVAEQQDSPLIISVKEQDVSGASSPQVRYTIRNVSDKAVRAYAILEETVTSNGGSTGATIIHFLKESEFLQPSQAKQGSFDESGGTDPVMTLRLSVDYVEFGDGTSWGKDTQHTAENLAGQREGKSAAFRKIREIVGAQGVDALLELLNKKDAEVAAPPGGRSRAWEYGFRVGHNSALYELKRAHAKGGMQALSSELRLERRGGG